MKRILSVIVLALTVATVAQAQSRLGGMRSSDRRAIRPDARIVTRDVRVAGTFNEILSRGMVDVEYRQSSGGRTEVRIVGPQNLVGHVEVDIRRGILEISMTHKIRIQGDAKLKVVVSAPDVGRISSAGSGDIRVIGRWKSPKIELSINGSGDFRFDRIEGGSVRLQIRGSGDIDGGQIETTGMVNLSIAGSGDIEIPRIDAKSIDVSIAGSGDIEIGGRAENAGYTLRGSGDISAYGLRAERVDATISGSGDISCHAGRSFRGTVSGSGTISFGGNPRNVDLRGNKRNIRSR